MISVITVLLGWQLTADFIVDDSRLLASPVGVAHELVEEWEFYWRNAKVTLWAAVRGFFFGSALGIALALVLTNWKRLEVLSVRVLTVIFAVPLVALAPIVRVIFDDRSPVALAALGVFFPVVLATLVGLDSVDSAITDVVRILGGGRFRVLRRARIPAAVPSLFAGLRIAVPNALLGTVVIESLGAESGLGVLLIGAMATLDTARAWAIGIVTAVMTALTFSLIARLGALAAPWQSSESGSDLVAGV